MRTNEPLQEDPLVEMGYEPQDLGLPAIKKFVIALFAFAIFSFAVVFGLFKLLKLDLNAADRARAEALPFQKRVPPAPNPLLQSNVTAKTAIADMRKTERAELENYAWVDRSKGIVRIPIDRAISLLAERGLAPTGKEVAAESAGTSAPEVLRAKQREEATQRSGQ
jgi:hypothetical protein